LLFGTIVLLGITAPARPSPGPPLRSSLKTVEGDVLTVNLVEGEGGIEVVQVTIAVEGDQGPAPAILLAPPEALEEIGFAVHPGDHLKVKYFVGEGESGKAHKVLNTTRGLMVRLRTLRQIPLWTNQGRWQGGQGRMQRGPLPGRGGG
jgi:hypothetical protein